MRRPVLVPPQRLLALPHQVVLLPHALQRQAHVAHTLEGAVVADMMIGQAWALECKTHKGATSRRMGEGQPYIMDVRCESVLCLTDRLTRK